MEVVTTPVLKVGMFFFCILFLRLLLLLVVVLLHYPHLIQLHLHYLLSIKNITRRQECRKRANYEDRLGVNKTKVVYTYFCEADMETRLQ